jgi:hypothetical protein
VIEIRYTLGSDANIVASLEGPVSSQLFTERQQAGEHIVRFTGVITTDVQREDYRLTRQVVPEGDYTIRLSATRDTINDQRRQVSFRVTHLDAESLDPPAIGNLTVRPDTISPNSDAIDDVAELTFRTPETTTLSVDLTGPNGGTTLAYPPIEKGPGEQNLVVTGQDLAGNTLPDGTYTMTLRLDDQVGNRVEAYRTITIEGGGEPSIEILEVEIAPHQIILGNSVAVSITVRNNGNVPLRTQGPDPGYTYTTNDSYSSIEGNRWTDKPGLWRVGVDWDGNTGGGPYRYPFRWGLGKTLMPGETVTTGGTITVLKQESTMWFYAGVLQEGVRIVLDRLGRTRIEVSF